MSLIFPTLFLFSCSVSLVLSFSPTHTDLQNQCLDDQKSALLQLHRDLYYAPNFTFSSKVEFWDPNTDCCSLKGITCDAVGHVIELDLSYKNLSGSFHSIFNLHHLQRLNLAGNNFNTTLFQYEFDRFSNLTHLNLSNSCFLGQIPVGISYLTSLVNCNLSGHFPIEVFLLQIQSIDISENDNLEGQLPEFSLNNTLRVLKISFTNFSGKLPESIGNLKFLTTLDLHGCKFFGQIPSSIANLTNLVELGLSYNNFSGFIPAFHRSGVPNLAYLFLWSNHLSGSIHSSLFALPSLQALDLSENELFGEIDECLNASSSLIETLYLGYNSFSSIKLDMFSQIKNLRVLDLSNMSLSIESNITSLLFPN
ncbi:probable inactive leucine-rich repeat receptor-like protein kinase At1g66830 [Durio zibethinus]|uniref:Probable inactive leucine-rich repeat receptor-like protein kinase At1g66830 n=1 Tax=Durio zibethinus TaxID=66656 RepID=A0A6P5X1J1_DURZI|nr:probable inactive leucine-rich repeat receptor-like protein kinase At1g66830 [Durio zibethinus]